MKRIRAFTYAEVLVVLAITLLVAALVMPNVVARKKSRDAWKFRSDLRSLGKNARSRAIEVGRTVSLGFDKTKNEVQVIELDVNGSEQLTHELALPEDVTPDRFMSDQDSNVGDSWRVPFYSDGGTPGGGIQFKEGEQTWSLVVSALDETIKDQAGPLPDFTYETWPAGTNVDPSTASSGSSTDPNSPQSGNSGVPNTQPPGGNGPQSPPPSGSNAVSNTSS